MVHDSSNLDSLKSAWQAKYQAKKLLQTASNYDLKIQQGDRYLAQNQLTEAISCYQHALKLDSNSTLAHQRLDQALKQQGILTKANHGQSLAITNRVTTTPDRQLTPTNNNLAIAQIYLQQAQTFEAQGEWQRAISACQEALSYNSQLASAYKTWGDSLQNLGNLGEALGCYAQALIIKPDFVEVCLNLGGLSFRQQQYNLAIEYYQKAISINSNCVSAYRNSARVYKKLGQQQLMLDCWYQALQLEPKSVDVVEHCNLAKIMVEMGLVERAIACYSIAIKLKPNLATAYFDLGKLLVSQNRLPQAVSVYRQGLKYFPRHNGINFNLAQLLVQTNHKSQAVKHYQQVIRNQPNPEAAYFQLAQILGEQQQEDAVKCYQKTLQLNPQNLEAYLNLEKLLIEQQRWSEAVQYCQKGIEVNAQQWEQYHYLGIALLNQQQYSQAIEVYARCLQLNPELVDGYHNLGLALFATQKWQKAIACWQQVAKRKPEDLENYRKIGEAAMQGQLWDIAISAWQQVIQLQDNDSWTYHHFGMALINRQQWREASDALQKSIELNPSFPWSYYHLGDALTPQQRWQEAEHAYRYFLTLEANSYAYERLGNTLLKQTQPFTPRGKVLQEEACQCFYRAIEVEPDYLQPYYKLMELKPYEPEIAFMLAEAFARQEEWSTAVIFYQIGLQINSDFPEVHFELGIVLEQLQQLDDAIAHYQSAIKLAPQESKYQAYLTKALQISN